MQSTNIHTQYKLASATKLTSAKYKKKHRQFPKLVSFADSNFVADANCIVYCMFVLLYVLYRPHFTKFNYYLQLIYQSVRHRSLSDDGGACALTIKPPK